MTNHQKYSSPSIKGLILIGGKSTRMGTDKSELNYHGKSQKEFAKKLLEDQGFETFYSVANDKGNADEIYDTLPNLGPFGGICSAFQKDANSAWFVLATDVPFINQEFVELLLAKRNPAKIATSVRGKNRKDIEPLITIYEPKAYPIFLQHLSQGNFSPKKILMESDVEIVEVADVLLRNINTLEEYKRAKKELTVYYK